MDERPNISDSEWLIMKVIWEKESATANDVVDALSSSTTWKPKTIMTMLTRLMKKGFLDYTKQGRAFVYYPLIQEEECVKTESRSFLKRVYGGSLKPMIANFFEDTELTKEDIEELELILENKKREYKR